MPRPKLPMECRECGTTENLIDGRRICRDCRNEYYRIGYHRRKDTPKPKEKIEPMQREIPPPRNRLNGIKVYALNEDGSRGELLRVEPHKLIKDGSWKEKPEFKIIPKDDKGLNYFVGYNKRTGEC